MKRNKQKRMQIYNSFKSLIIYTAFFFLFLDLLLSRVEGQLPTLKFGRIAFAVMDSIQKVDRYPMQKQKQKLQQKHEQEKSPQKEESMREWAEREHKRSPLSEPPTTETTILKLKDKPVDLKKRNWKGSFLFHLSPYRPEGRGEFVGVNDYELNQAHRSLLPGITWGFQIPLEKNTDEELWGEMGINGYYLKQKIDLITVTNLETEADLQTSVGSAQAGLLYRHQRISKIWFKVGFEWGIISIMQTSKSTLAQWQNQGRFYGVHLGIRYDFQEKYFMESLYRKRVLSLSSDSYFGFQGDFIQMSLGVLW